jgi:hypothetical protein
MGSRRRRTLFGLCSLPVRLWDADSGNLLINLGNFAMPHGADRGILRLLCTVGQGTFSARQGMASCGVRAQEANDLSAMRALAEGHSLRGTGRLVEVEKDTVCDWLDRARRLVEP